MSPRARQWASWITHGVVASAFALAGSLKLLDPAQFAEEIGNYRLFPALITRLAAVYLPWLELTLAVSLLLPRFRAVARGLAGALLGVFCAALASTLIRGIDVECGCFGSAATTSAEWALARNGLLIGFLTLGAWLKHRPAAPGPNPKTDRPSG